MEREAKVRPYELVLTTYLRTQGVWAVPTNYKSPVPYSFLSSC